MVNELEQLDLLIVGCKTGDLTFGIENMKSFQEISGAFRSNILKTPLFYDKRVSFMKLLNLMVQKATGTNSNFHFAEMPNVAVFYLKGCVDKGGFTSKIINSFDFDKEEFIEELRKKPKAVAITTTYYVEPSPLIEIVQFIRKINPDICIVVGGPFIFNWVLYRPKKYWEFWFHKIGADYYIVDAQGDITLCKVLSFLKGGMNRSLIANLIYSDGDGGFIQTEREEETTSMNELYIDWSLFDKCLYAPTVNVLTSRGCPFKCKFCNSRILSGSVDIQSVDVLERQLLLLKKGGVRNISFVDIAGCKSFATLSCMKKDFLLC